MGKPLPPHCYEARGTFGQVWHHLPNLLGACRSWVLHCQTERIKGSPASVGRGGEEAGWSAVCPPPSAAPGSTAGWGSGPVSTWLVDWKQLLTGPLGSFRGTGKNGGLGRWGLVGQERQKQTQAPWPSSSTTEEGFRPEAWATTPNAGRRNRELETQPLNKLKHC